MKRKKNTIPTRAELAAQKKLADQQVEQELGVVLLELYKKLGKQLYSRIVLPVAPDFHCLEKFLRWAKKKLAELLADDNIIPFPTA